MGSFEGCGVYARQVVEDRQFAGVAWSIDYRGAMVSSGEVGFTDHALMRPVTADTVYRIYSMTKPVVSVLCLMLVDAGQLQLDDAVSRWIPQLATAKVLQDDGSLEPVNRAITIGDLLTHRAGFSYDFLPDCAVAEQYRGLACLEDGSRTLDELVELLVGLPLTSQPGERWIYSFSIDVLACVLQRILQIPLAEALQQRLFAPLGMSDTGFHVAATQRHRVAEMFGQRALGDLADATLASNELQAMSVEKSYPAVDKLFTRGGVGLFSTISDYRQFMQILFDGKSASGQVFLSSVAVENLWHNQLQARQMPIAIGTQLFPGYGWGLSGRVMVDNSVAEIVTCHAEGGWSGAASTHFWVDRENQFSGIVMAQYLGSAVKLGAQMQSKAYQDLYALNQS